MALNGEIDTAKRRRLIRAPDGELQTKSHICLNVVVLYCDNGKVTMSKEEFTKLLNAGNILEQLVYGSDDMKKENNLDIFKQYHVTTGGLNLIRYCARTDGKLPDDEKTISFIEKGYLRDVAETLGGFPLVDAALKDHHQCKEAQKYTPCINPKNSMEDMGTLYGWHTCFEFSNFLNPEFTKYTIQFQSPEGFEWCSMERYETVGCHHFRRRKE